MKDHMALLGPTMWFASATASPIGWDADKWAWLICTIIGAVANAYVLIETKREQRARKQGEKADEVERSGGSVSGGPREETGD